VNDISIGSRVRSTSGHDWDVKWQDCTVTDVPNDDGYMHVVRASDGRVGFLCSDQVELIPTAPIPSEVGPEVVERLRASHAELLERIERDQCEHENTHRGGAIWTICEDCGEKWADDRGGFQPYVAPDWLVEAREVARALLPEPVDADLLEVRRIVADAVPEAMRAGILAGDQDHTISITAPLACLKRGRALAAGDRHE